MGTSPFARGTAVTSAGGDRFTANLPPIWNCPTVPQGGIVVATVARAMAAALGDESQPLRSISAVFAGPVEAGPVVIDVAVLRRGRSMSQCTATIRNPAAGAGTTAIAVFGGLRRGYDFTDIAPPRVPPPHECPSFRDPPPVDFEHGEPFAFWDNVEGRPALGHAPWEDYEPTSSLNAIWHRFDETPRLDDGRWDPFAVVALCDTMPGAVGERLGPHEERWVPPSADFTAHVLNDTRADYLLAVNRARHAGDGYASVDMEMWDLDGNDPVLVAYATQMMFFVFPK